MKKVLSCLLAVLLLASLSVSAFAADELVSSVENAGAPEIVSAVDANGNDLTAKIVITPYDERESLAEDVLAVLEKAYDVLKEAEDLTALNDSLKELAGEKAIAAGELFDISAVEEIEFPVTITLKAENLENFVALLHFVDEEFVVVEEPEVDAEEGTVVFTVDSLSPFAVIVNAEEA